MSLVVRNYGVLYGISPAPKSIPRSQHFLCVRSPGCLATLAHNATFSAHVRSHRIACSILLP
jgi:hypothetical protein